jgi:DNA-binding transcriptional LysR family regulator
MEALGYLPTFIAVCDAGGFVRASERLHLSQPAVSYQMRALEQQLGVRLFSRAGRGVVLTDAGAQLRELAKAALRDFHDLRQALLTGKAQPRVLRIASVSAFGRYVLFPVLERRWKDARIELRFPTQEEVLRQVEAGIADIGFVYEARVRSSLRIERAATEELVLVTPARGAHALQQLAFKTLVRTPFVTWDEYEYVFGRWFDAVFGNQPGELRSAAHFEEMEEVLAWVAGGNGVSIVPRDCIRGKVNVLSGRRRCTNELFAVWRPDREREDVLALVNDLRAAAAATARPAP